MYLCPPQQPTGHADRFVEVKANTSLSTFFSSFLCLVQDSILSSAWCGGKSRLEQMVERQQATLRALMSTHTEKLARLKQQDRLYVPCQLLHLLVFFGKTVETRPKKLSQFTPVLVVFLANPREAQVHTWPWLDGVLSRHIKPTEASDSCPSLHLPWLLFWQTPGTCKHSRGHGWMVFLECIDILNPRRHPTNNCNIAHVTGVVRPRQAVEPISESDYRMNPSIPHSRYVISPPVFNLSSFRCLWFVLRRLSSPAPRRIVSERRNLVSTLAAERKKVILYCRREATKRRTKDIAAGAKEARKMNAHK